MISVGLAKELNFISVYFKTEISCCLESSLCDSIQIKIKNNQLNVFYQNRHIWQEFIEGDTAFFGIESCDSIARIIAALNVGNVTHAESLIFIDKTANP